MTFFLIFTTAICFFLLGYVVIELCGLLKGASLLEKLSYSWGLGVGLIGIQMFLYSISHIPWSRLSILLPWGIIFVILLVRTKQIPKFKKVKVKLSRLEIFFVLLIMLLLFFTGFESILRPIQAWDGWANWVFRSKVFFLHNNVTLDYVRYTHDDYPLIIPLMGTFGYIMMGGINDKYVLFLFFVFYLALGGLFFATSKKLLNTKKAIVLTFLLLSLQNLIRHGGHFEAGYADLALGYYIFAVTCLLAGFLKTKNKKTLLFLSLFLGITGQIKNDGIPFVVIVSSILLFVIIAWRKYWYVLFMLPSVLIFALWELYKIFNHYPNNFLFRDALYVHTDKVVAIVLAMSKEFFNFQNWSLLWVAFLVSLIVAWRKIHRVKLFLLVFCLQWLSYFAIFMVTPREPVGHVENIIDRLYIHLAPLAVLMVGLLFDSLVWGNSSKTGS